MNEFRLASMLLHRCKHDVLTEKLRYRHNALAETLWVSCNSKTPRILAVAVGNYVGYIWCPDLDICAMYWQRHLIWHKQGKMPVI